MACGFGLCFGCVIKTTNDKELYKRICRRRGVSFRFMENLTLKLFGKTLKNPVMNASGTLGYGKEMESLWGIETLGAYVTKGLSAKPHHGNPVPRVWEERNGMINSIGLQNIGVERFFLMNNSHILNKDRHLS